ncbi:hypothetical protein DDT91_14190 [Algoriphagus sp. AK58]|nr:hypothetical protein [Algoriphagus sp. AK58]
MVGFFIQNRYRNIRANYQTARFSGIYSFLSWKNVSNRTQVSDFRSVVFWQIPFFASNEAFFSLAFFWF